MRACVRACVYLVQEACEEGVGHVVVEECALVHQDALDVLAEGRILTQQLHTRLRQHRLKENNFIIFYILILSINV